MNRQTAEPILASRSWTEEALAFEVWKYYATVGGADKDRMVHIASWLLGFSAGIFSLHATGKLTVPGAELLLTGLGGLVSLLAAFVALLYGGYATWNWAIGDQIAKTYAWPELFPTNDPIPKLTANWWAKLAFGLAKPRVGTLAPVFWLFFIVSILSAVVHLVLLFLSPSKGAQCPPYMPT
jgi:hypothetical protein